ncbi:MULTISPECIES: SMI1/KNR4 family protein [unclassified Streptomyces]|uniref:SMI1/KNR4 family protein n=1 Tax=unclassified Streptomyces TaxID=2593676 RepID=UPI002E2DD5C7|nr:SMI1/KNR4 family protein [Streptomyces sp. NBC_00223]
MGAWELLRGLMPVTAESDTSVDWGRAEESWGKTFPPDYRKFIETYGAGVIENYLVIFKPEFKGGQPESDYGGMIPSTLDAEGAWVDYEKSPELQGAAPELIAWGGDSSADLLCWDASGSDPEAWPVLVWNRDDLLWSRYDCGMVEFLVRMLREEFSECPLGGLSLWGKQPALFLNEREKERLLAQGLDPWTGEPDPFAGRRWG